MGKKKRPPASVEETASQIPEIDRLFALATQHHHSGRHKQAEATLMRIQKICPDIPEVLNFLGMMALQDNRRDIARGHVEKALGAQPDSAESNHLLGIIELKEG